VKGIDLDQAEAANVFGLLDDESRDAQPAEGGACIVEALIVELMQQLVEEMGRGGSANASGIARHGFG